MAIKGGGTNLMPFFSTWKDKQLISTIPIYDTIIDLDKWNLGLNVKEFISVWSIIGNEAKRSGEFGQNCKIYR